MNQPSKNVPVKKESQALSVFSSVGAMEVNSDNFVISKVLPMQPTSDLVSDGVAKYGEFRDSVTQELIGEADKAAIKFVPVYIQEEWLIQTDDGGRPKFLDRIPYNNSNKGLPRKEFVKGGNIKRTHMMNFYVLLMSDLEKGIDFPKIISFKDTSERAGKVLYTQMIVMNARQGLSPHGMVMNLIGKKTENDKGKFVVLSVTPDAKAHEEYVQAASKWAKTIASGAVKVDEAE